MKSTKAIPCVMMFVTVAVQLFAQNDRANPYQNNQGNLKSINSTDSLVIHMGDISSTHFHLNFLSYGALFSFKVEKLLAQSKNGAFSLGLGAGYNTEVCLLDLFCPPSQRYYLLPHQFTRLIGRKRSYLEIGIGGSLVFVNELRSYIFYPVLGYRRLPKRRKGSIFSLYLNPVLAGSDSYDLSAPFGLSLSLSLN